AATPAVAYFLDQDETIQLLARAYTQVGLRTQDSDGFTFPETPAGRLIQQRNLLELELAHDLDDLFHPPGISGISYRLRYKGVYEGVYDYGPDEYSEQVETNPPSPFDPGAPDESRTNHRTRVLRHSLGSRHELWNAYAQGESGPLFVRLGRQDLSWGETDGFRLLDMIEPLDNRFGLPLVEDLDDRRIPLWMARGSLALPWHGPEVSNLVLEGYLVPGAIEDQEAPLAPRGSPFAAPAPPSFFGRVVTVPGRQMANSRGGGRLIATLFGNATATLAHYVTRNDAPAVRAYVGGVDFVDARPVPDVALQFAFYRQQVTGASYTMQLAPIDTVLRTEVAMFWDERVLIPREAGLTPDRLPGVIGAAIADRAAGGPGIAGGRFSERDVFRWVAGFDRFLWIRPLNPTNVFSVSGQLFHTHVLDHSDEIVNGIVDADTGSFVERKADELTMTLLARSLFWRGRLEPQVFSAYDPRGVWSVVPGITWIVGSHVRLTAKYAYVAGNFVNLGFFRDRDEALFRAEVSL
ncbi:MAG: hypothetical protein QOD06_3268, partial [Candidatus Binatota bacterium]|nr:hypothetical protein [Candidatus Binatota bacterium]